MAAVDIDRQAIERRDFPISRRGYEPAAVDAHLRALASEIEQLQRERADGGGPEPSLATTAGSQVQSILAATEAAAADIEQQARESARTTREDADRDAAQTRAEAIERARAHVAAVSQATAALLERVGAMDSEVSALVESLRGGANRLAADLAAVETNMGELYDAAAGRPLSTAVAGGAQAQPTVPAPPSPGPPAPTASAAPPIPPPPASGAAAPAVKRAQTSPPPLSPPEGAEPEAHVDPEAPPPRQRIAGGSPTASMPGEPDSSDLDSARLVALNMALNGDSREDAERYLAENFTLADRGKLIDEVFAAIEG
jgi:cell division septum initiation protein DivIVA